jgi:hypothetical protein
MIMISKSSSSSNNNLKLIDKTILLLYPKLIANAKIDFGYKDKNYNTEEDEEEENDEDSDAELARFVHLLIRTYPRIKERRKLEEADYYLSVETLLIESGLVSMTFLFQLMHSHNYRFGTQHIIDMVVQGNKGENRLNQFANLYNNDIVHQDDFELSSYITTNFNYSQVCGMCRKVLKEVDNFTQAGDFLSHYLFFTVTRWDPRNDTMPKEERLSSPIWFLLDIFPPDVIIELQGKVIYNKNIYCCLIN